MTSSCCFDSAGGGSFASVDAVAPQHPSFGARSNSQVSTASASVLGLTRLHTLRCRVNFASGVHADFTDADDRFAVLGFADVGCAWRSLLVQMRDQFIIGPVVPLGDSKYDRALSIHCRQQMHEFFVV